jgi:hypothetical protein
VSEIEGDIKLYNDLQIKLLIDSESSETRPPRSCSVDEEITERSYLPE